MAYVIYILEEERYDICGYFDLDQMIEDYSVVVLYEGCFDDCIDYLERL